MESAIYHLSFIPLIILSYFLAIKLYARFNRSIGEARDSISRNTLKREKKKFLRDFNSRLNGSEKIRTHFEKVNHRLVCQGNLYKLTPVTYYLIKIVPTLFLIFVFISRNIIGFIPFISIIFLFFFVDIRYYLQNEEDKKHILKELPLIYNALEVQSYGDIPFEKSLMSLHSMIKCKRLREAFIDLSAEIITKKDIVSALHNMESKFDMQEIYSFTLTIEQGLETGKIREMLGNQRSILYKTYLTVKDDETNKNELKVTLCLMLLLVSSSAITIYSFFCNIVDQLKFIFK